MSDPELPAPHILPASPSLYRNKTGLSQMNATWSLGCDYREQLSGYPESPCGGTFSTCRTSKKPEKRHVGNVPPHLPR